MGSGAWVRVRVRVEPGVRVRGAQGLGTDRGALECHCTLCA